jgi:hypothetical protein
MSCNNHNAAVAREAGVHVYRRLPGGFFEAKASWSWSWTSTPTLKEYEVCSLWFPSADGVELQVHLSHRSGDSRPKCVLEVCIDGSGDTKTLCWERNGYHHLLCAEGQWYGYRKGKCAVYRSSTAEAPETFRAWSGHHDYESRATVYAPSMRSLLMGYGCFDSMDVLPLDPALPVVSWKLEAPLRLLRPRLLRLLCPQERCIRLLCCIKVWGAADVGGRWEGEGKGSGVLFCGRGP